MTKAAAEDSGFLAEYQVYQPHKVGLPPLKPYFKELWRRREFAAEYSRASMRAANTRTFFGQLWLVLNPLLLALVYFMLVSIIRASSGGLEYLTHLVAGLFVFYFVAGSIQSGAGSVVQGGSLISNMAFPRLLMPLSTVRTAFFRFLPTVPVYLAIHAISGATWSWKIVLALYFLACMVAFSAGLAAIFAALQVYFRDTSSFLPYMVRIWLYLSPILWYIEDVPPSLAPLIRFNPLVYLIGGWSDLLVRSQLPPLYIWVGAAAWGIAAAVVGSLFFMSREREFAVRL